MLFDRFDSAILYLFTIEQLALPFTVEQRSPHEWEVMQHGEALGVVSSRIFCGKLHYRATHTEYLVAAVNGD